MSQRSKLWVLLAEAYPTWLRKVYKMDIGKSVRIAHGAHLEVIKTDINVSNGKILLCTQTD